MALVSHVITTCQGKGVRKRSTSEVDSGRSSKIAKTEASRKINEFFRNSSQASERKKDASVQVLSLCLSGPAPRALCSPLD